MGETQQIPGLSRRVCCPATTPFRGSRGHACNKKAEQSETARLLEEAPGNDLLLHGLSHTTIGAGAFHFRVRDGIGWDHTAMVAREGVETAQ